MADYTVKQKEELTLFWAKRREKIGDHVSHKCLFWFDALTVEENFGDKLGQVRLGRSGRWDLYFGLQAWGCDEYEAIYASGLPEAEAANEELRRQFHRPVEQLAIKRGEKLLV